MCVRMFSLCNSPVLIKDANYMLLTHGHIYFNTITHTDSHTYTHTLTVCVIVLLLLLLEKIC